MTLTFDPILWERAKKLQENHSFNWSRLLEDSLEKQVTFYEKVVEKIEQLPDEFRELALITPDVSYIPSGSDYEVEVLPDGQQKIDEETNQLVPDNEYVSQFLCPVVVRKEE